MRLQKSGCGRQAGRNLRLHGRPAVLDQCGIERLSQLGNGRNRHDQPPEAKLAREAEMCYATVAMVTDYDCWHPHHDSVTVDQIVAVLLKNAENATTRRARNGVRHAERAKAANADQP